MKIEWRGAALARFRIELPASLAKLVCACIHCDANRSAWHSYAFRWLGCSGIKKVLVVMALGVLGGSVTGTAMACPPDVPDEPVEQIRYQVEEGRVWRVNKTRGTRELKPEFGDQVRLIATSKRNCVFEVRKQGGKTKDVYYRSSEPNLIAWVTEDNKVWLKGQAWAFGAMEMWVHTVDPPSRPPKVFSSQKPFLIPQDPDSPLTPKVLEVAEHWVAVVNSDGVIWGWGWHYSGMKSAMVKTGGLGPRFGSMKFQSILAWDQAMFALNESGEITGFGRYHICTDTFYRSDTLVQQLCPFSPTGRPLPKKMSTRKGENPNPPTSPRMEVAKMWVDEQWNGRCWLALKSGETFDFACDDPKEPVTYRYLHARREQSHKPWYQPMLEKLK